MAFIFDSFLSKEKVVPTKWEKVKPLSCIMPTTFSKKLCTFLDLDIKKGPWIAGGSVRKAYFNESIGNSDWDVWFRNEYQYEQAKLKMESVDNAQISYTSENAITYKIDDQIVQLIKRNYYPNVEDLLDSFDITACQFATDGLYFRTGETSVQDCNNRIINYRKDITTPGAIKRIVKYVVYGFRPSPDIMEKIYQSKDTITFAHSGNEYDE